VHGDPYSNFTIDPVQGVLKPATHVDFEQLITSAGDVTGRGVNVRPISLVVQAQDMGTPSLSSQVLVTIYVQDVNDHAPRFEKSEYTRSIPEDMQGGSSVLQVRDPSRHYRVCRILGFCSGTDDDSSLLECDGVSTYD
jgi:hypothetical protein